jgi:hypothetical protein
MRLVHSCEGGRSRRVSHHLALGPLDEALHPRRPYRLRQSTSGGTANTSAPSSRCYLRIVASGHWVSQISSSHTVHALARWTEGGKNGLTMLTAGCSV